jgi:hypothetical protein
MNGLRKCGAQQVQSPEFKLQYCQEKKRREKVVEHDS